MKKMISWNVNGLRACVGKGFLDVFHELDADIFCMIEDGKGESLENRFRKPPTKLKTRRFSNPLKCLSGCMGFPTIRNLIPRFL